MSLNGSPKWGGDDITDIIPEVHYFTNNHICEFHTVEPYSKIYSESHNCELK